jgi:hypothetical protein
MTTISRRTMQVAVAVAALMAANAAPAHAQLGGLKKKVQQAVGQTAGQQAPGSTGATSPAAAATGSTGGSVKLTGNVLPMDDDVLDRLTKAIAAQDADLKAAGAALAKLPTQQAYDSCQQQLMQGPTGQAAAADYMKAIEDAGDDQAKMQKAMMDMDSALKVVYLNGCGASTKTDLDDKRSALQKRPHGAGAQAGGFTASQYAVLKERVLPFCNAGSKLQQAQGGAKVHSMGGVYYVYTDDEIQALHPRCGALTTALAAIS